MRVTTQDPPERLVARRRVLLKPDAVAEQLGVSVGTLANWRVSGKGPRFVKLQSGGIRYSAYEIEADLVARTRCSTSDGGLSA